MMDALIVRVAEIQHNLVRTRYECPSKRIMKEINTLKYINTLMYTSMHTHTHTIHTRTHNTHTHIHTHTYTHTQAQDAEVINEQILASED